MAQDNSSSVAQRRQKVGHRCLERSYSCLLLQLITHPEFVYQGQLLGDSLWGHIHGPILHEDLYLSLSQHINFSKFPAHHGKKRILLSLGQGPSKKHKRRSVFWKPGKCLQPYHPGRAQSRLKTWEKKVISGSVWVFSFLFFNVA